MATIQRSAAAEGTQQAAPEEASGISGLACIHPPQHIPLRRLGGVYSMLVDCKTFWPDPESVVAPPPLLAVLKIHVEHRQKKTPVAAAQAAGSHCGECRGTRKTGCNPQEGRGDEEETVVENPHNLMRLIEHKRKHQEENWARISDDQMAGQNMMAWTPSRQFLQHAEQWLLVRYASCLIQNCLLLLRIWSPQVCFVANKFGEGVHSTARYACLLFQSEALPSHVMARMTSLQDMRFS